MLPKQTQASFDKALQQVQDYGKTHQVNNVGDAVRALSDLNVPKDFLSNTGGLSSNPVVSSIARFLNVNVDKIQQDINKLNSSGTNTDLSGFKKDLENLRRK